MLLQFSIQVGLVRKCYTRQGNYFTKSASSKKRRVVMTLETRTHLAVCPVQTTNLLSPSKLGSRPDNVGEFKENKRQFGHLQADLG